MTNLNEDQFGDYHGQHRPAGPGYGSPLHDVEGSFPGIHERPRLYAFHEPAVDRESFGAIRAAKGNPEADVTIYRAAPGHVKSINPGDWVTTSRKYAEQHAMQDDDPKHDWPVLSQQVKARHLYTEGNDVNEWGYHPE